MAGWSKISNEIRDFLRLRTEPLAVKFLEREEDLSRIEKLRTPEARVTVCQAAAIARVIGWTIGLTVHNIMMPDCMWKLGLVETAKSASDGLTYKGIWCETQEDAAKFVRQMPRLPVGKYKAIVFSPLASERIELPDVVYIFATPAQMCLLMNGLQWKDYERFKFYFRGEGSCADSLIECFLNGKPQLTVPCFGERIFGHVQDDELEIAMPSDMAEKALLGLHELRRARTIAYPIPILGPRADLYSLSTPVYPGVPKYVEAVSRGETPDYK